MTTATSRGLCARAAVSPRPVTVSAGHTAGPQWTVSYTDRRGDYHSSTYTAQYLLVYYRRDAILLRPDVALTSTFGRLVFGLQAGWMFQLSQGCLLLLQQEDNSNDVNTIARIHQPHNGLLDGLYATLSIGLIDPTRHLFGDK